MAGKSLTWIELSRAAIQHNVGLFRQHLSPSTKLLVPVKGNGYGHGLKEIAPAFVEAGADWLGVHSLQEAIEVQKTGVTVPILLLGYVPYEGLEEVVARGFRAMVTTWETAEALARAAAAQEKVVPVHLKLETGTNRQGLRGRELLILARSVADSRHLHLEGCYTHFANIEDTTDHRYAMRQLTAFQEEIKNLEAHGITIPLKHTAASAATLLFPETHYDLARVGIASYGLWPSKETYVSLLKEGKKVWTLRPVLSWKTIVSQIKEVKAGEYVGYGCTYRTTRDIKIAILPIGYYDGLDRGVSNLGHVLIRGQRAPIRGRVCMNLTMVDVTDIPGVLQEDEVVVIGRQGEEEVSADQMAAWIGSIHYEVVTRLLSEIPRKLVP